MQETVTNERKSLFSSFLEVLEAREKQAQAERQLQEEKYQRRTRRIYEFHERQQREAVELQRCVEYVSQHVGVLESVLRGAGGEGVPLSAALVRHAAALQRCMAQCVDNASRIRRLLTAAHQPQMDSMLAKMEAELSTWTAFLQRAGDATYNTEVVIDNLQNLVVEQKRCVREVSASSVYRALCGSGEPEDAAGGPAATPRGPASEESEGGSESEGPHTAGTRRGPSAACSTPLSRD